jgi:N-acetylneuraminate synthase/sialic acid synthase
MIKMGKQLVAARDLPAGHAIRRDDIAIKSPGGGLQPYEIDQVIGRNVRVALKADDTITLEVLSSIDYSKMVA